uniref:Uncharacterized protein n=1 Tax=viral metagenome TaxID=1070528 RepID=A0A6C0LY21_9ZZZZ
MAYHNAGLRRDARYANSKVDTLDVKRIACNGDTPLQFTSPSGIVLGNSTWLSSAPERYQLEEFFRRNPGINADIQDANEAVRMIVNSDFELLGTNGVSANSTFSTTRGGVLLTTDANANDQVIIAPHLDANQSAWAQIGWGTENQVVWECGVATGTTIAAEIVWAGLKLTNTPVIATDNDQVFFRYETGVDTNWNAVYSIGGTDVEVNTGVVVAINTTYNFRVVIDAARIAKMYINNVLVATTTALTNDVNLIPYVGIQTTAAFVKTLNLSYEKISRHVFE